MQRIIDAIKVEVKRLDGVVPDEIKPHLERLKVLCNYDLEPSGAHAELTISLLDITADLPVHYNYKAKWRSSLHHGSGGVFTGTLYSIITELKSLGIETFTFTMED